MPLWKGLSMPIYEFRCDDCEHIQDVVLGFDAPKEVFCEKCNKQMFRVWTANPAHFKGDGWASKEK